MGGITSTFSFQADADAGKRSDERGCKGPKVSGSLKGLAVRSEGGGSDGGGERVWKEGGISTRGKHENDSQDIRHRALLMLSSFHPVASCHVIFALCQKIADVIQSLRGDRCNADAVPNSLLCLRALEASILILQQQRHWNNGSVGGGGSGVGGEGCEVIDRHCHLTLGFLTPSFPLSFSRVHAVLCVSFLLIPSLPASPTSCNTSLPPSMVHDILTFLFFLMYCAVYIQISSLLLSPALLDPPFVPQIQ